MREGNASSTAKVIAASTILLASDERTTDLVPPQAARLCDVFLSTSRADRALAASARQPVTRSLWQGLERLVLPGIMQHYWHRKRWIEHWCRRGIADGFTRIVVVGAGLDTLGCRLAQEFGALQVIEVDHPASQERKRQALAAAPGGAPANLHFMPCDLAGESLPMKAFAGDRPTLVVLEAVLMYLDALDVDRVFQTLRTARGRPLRILFTTLSAWPDGSSGFRPHSWLVDRWLALRGEPLRWSISPRQVGDFLQLRGFRMQELVQAPDLCDGTDADGPVLEGENVVTCEPLGPPAH